MNNDVKKKELEFGTGEGRGLPVLGIWMSARLNSWLKNLGLSKDGREKCLKRAWRVICCMSAMC